MPELLIPDLEPELHERLAARAARNGRTVEDEVKLILRSAGTENAAIWGWINRRREELSRTHTQRTDSVDLIREDRDR
jgi:plasmid stability protein